MDLVALMDLPERRDAATLSASLAAAGLSLEGLRTDGKGTIAAPGATPFPGAAGGREAAQRDLRTLPRVVTTGGEAAAPSRDPAPETLGGGEVRLTGTVLGAGGMGVIHQAEQVPLRREVAVKVLARGDADPAEVADLLREARVTGALQHPSIVPIHLLARSEGDRPLIVMKRIEGVAWSRYLEDPTLVPDPDRIGWHLGVLLQVTRAVEYAHSLGVLHRDLKPANVMVGAFGEVYVLDWGLAVTLRDDDRLDLPRAREVVHVAGTPEYLAPEMAGGKGELLGPATDVYLLGACLHEVVSGRPPHTGTSLVMKLVSAWRSTPPELGPEVPAELAGIVRTALAARPEDRFPSAAAFRGALEDFLRHRHAAGLAAGAHERIDRLDAALADFCSSSGSVDPGAGALKGLHDLYGGALFALEESLRGWPENVEARRGLQRLHELMVRCEVAQGDVLAAESHLACLPDPRPDLSALVTDLRARLAARDAELARLQRLEHEGDLAVARPVRWAFVLSMAAVLGAVYFALGALDRAGVFSARHGTWLAIHLGYGAVLAAGALVARRKVEANEANRRYFWALGAAAVAGAALWTLALASGLDFVPALAANMLLFFTVLWMGSAAVAWPMKWASLPYLAASFLVALAPTWAHEWVGLATLLALPLAVWAERRA